MSGVGSLETSGLVLILALAGAAAGLWLRRFLPEDHLSADSKSVINLSMGLVGTMSALVLGLLIGQAHTSYQQQVAGLEQMSAQLIVVDRMMARVGPSAAPARQMLKTAAAAALGRIWSDRVDGGEHIDDTGTTARATAAYDALADLQGLDQRQAAMRDQALQMLTTIAQTRWLLFEEAAGNSLQAPFLAVLILWLVILFGSFGLMSPQNATVKAALIAGAISVSGAVFLILELNSPFSGILRISNLPLRAALSHMGG
jgi:hypothetical protein